MIFYSSDSWSGQILRFTGTVWPAIWWKVFVVTGYTCIAYSWCEANQTNLGSAGHSILGKTISFLLVFRANNAYSRYWQGRTCLTLFGIALRDLVVASTMFLPGGRRGAHWRWRQHDIFSGHLKNKDAGLSTTSHKESMEELNAMTDVEDTIVSEERTHIIRWALVLAIAFKMHTRILDPFTDGSMSAETKFAVDWDRLRIRKLLNANEFRDVDRFLKATSTEDIWEEVSLNDDLAEAEAFFDERSEPPREWPSEYAVSMSPIMRMPLVVMYRLQEIIWRNMNDQKLNDKKYGIKERFMPVFGTKNMDLLRSFTMIIQIVTTPVPFPYFHLCKSLLFFYFVSFPFFIAFEMGFYANVVELCFLAVALLGVDAIATELENPFGEDANDLDLMEPIDQVENEMMAFLELCGDGPCRNNFVWQDIPDFVRASCSKPVNHYLSLRTQVESHGRSPNVLVGGAAERAVTSLGNEKEEGDDDMMSEDS